MDRRDLHDLLEDVAAGMMTPQEAERVLSSGAYTDLGYARVDNERGMRQGVSEVIYGEGKTADQIAGIARAMLDAGQRRILVTRLAPEKYTQLPVDLSMTYDEQARIGMVGSVPEPDGNGFVLVVCAGTSDLPVAEEAALTAEMLGNEVHRVYDAGVSGLHRLLASAEEIAQAQVIVVVAGMEGALASVVGGLASCPVIAVPTSVGYGASLNGIAALLAMLNSCASGVSVVNIDNGFGAGCQASLINHVVARPSAIYEQAE